MDLVLTEPDPNEQNFEFELKIDDKHEDELNSSQNNDPPINLFDVEMKYQSVDLSQDDNAEILANFNPAVQTSADEALKNNSDEKAAARQSLGIGVNIDQGKTSEDVVVEDIPHDKVSIPQQHYRVDTSVREDYTSLSQNGKDDKEVLPRQDELVEESGISLEDILIKSKQAREEETDEFDFEFTSTDEQPKSKPTVSSSPQKPKETAATSVVTQLDVTQKDSAKSEQVVAVSPALTSQTTSESTPKTDDKEGSSGITPVPAVFSGDRGSEPVVPTFQNSKAQSEWDNVQTIEASFADETEGSKGTPVVTAAPLLSYHEFQDHFSKQDFSNVKGNIHTSVDRHGFSALKHFLFGPPKMHRNLHEERDNIFCIAASTFANDDQTHVRALQTIYRCLTGSRFDCGRYGSHWEEIGFQGNDPSTDLRGAGLLGLMNLIHMLRDPRKQVLGQEIYKLSLHPTQNFPFCVMGINMSRITLQSLREDCLNKECNRRGEVGSVVNDFYTGLYLQMYQVWKSQGKTIKDSGYVIKDIEANGKKNPKSVFKNLEEYLAKKKSTVNLDAMDLGGQNFLNVVDTDAGQY